MKSFIKDLVVALIIVGIISFVIKPTIVKESSMEPTLYNNNYLLLNKLAYMTKEHPSRGDIVVFRSDLEREDGKGKKLLIKRVIAVEGDELDIVSGKVYINGKRIDESYIKDDYTDGDITNFIIPEDGMFVMGDNRGNSTDSRSEGVGVVEEDRIVGKAFLRLYPFNRIGTLK